MKRILYAALFAVATLPCLAQTSPASEALDHAAKDVATEQKSYDTALMQAKSTLDASMKDLQKQSADLTKSLNDQLAADKKYKPMLDKISVLQKQLQSLSSDASQKFAPTAGPIQNQIATDKALVDGLVPVVRKENGWPDTATYDSATQTWKGIPPAAEKK